MNSKNKKALILGISGQDASLLASFLLGRSYKIFGQSRAKETFSNANLKTLFIEDSIELRFTSLQNINDVEELIGEVMPDEIYNFSGQSSVGKSFHDVIDTANSHINSTVNILETIRKVNSSIRFFNAGSGECFGETGSLKASELTRFNPVSPYAISKTTSTMFTTLYRESYDMFCCTGIFFNHESALRNINFVTKKIDLSAIRIKEGQENKITLGNIDVVRDWGWAQDYMEAAWLMLNKDVADDYIIATGVSQTLKSFAEAIFTQAGLDLHQYLEIDQSLYRKNEPQSLIADITKIKKNLPWKPVYAGANVARKLYIETEKLMDKNK